MKQINSKLKGRCYMNNKEYLGKILDIEIDREFGSKHPKHGFIYPVNYGYIPNTISGDGEELDCHRTNDDDDKLIIVPENKEYSDDAINALVEFQEQYFEHIIIR